MGFEIERKFLVRGGEWQQIATKYTEIRQAYLSVGGKSSVRVRISDNRTATLTVKSRPAELRRLELEYEAYPVDINMAVSSTAAWRHIHHDPTTAGRWRACCRPALREPADAPVSRLPNSRHQTKRRVPPGHT